MVVEVGGCVCGGGGGGETERRTITALQLNDSLNRLKQRSNKFIMLGLEKTTAR